MIKNERAFFHEIAEIVLFFTDLRGTLKNILFFMVESFMLTLSVGEFFRLIFFLSDYLLNILTRAEQTVFTSFFCELRCDA